MDHELFMNNIFANVEKKIIRIQDSFGPHA